VKISRGEGVEEGDGHIVRDERTDERLGNQPANGTRKPHQRRELFRQSQTQQERRPISVRVRKHWVTRDAYAKRA